MSLWKLVKRSVSFYRRTNVGVFLAAAVGTAILTGALLVGDSVRYSLARMVTARLGGTEVALVTQDRFFRAELADRLAAELGSQVSPVLGLRGLITNSDGTRRAGRIEVWGVDGRFYKLGASPNPFDSFSGEGVILNEALASRLGASRGDEVVLRISRPGVMPRDIPLSPDSDLSTAFRLPVRGVASEGDFGLFSLQANQASPLNAFVSLRWLSEKLERAGGANVLLAGGAITVEKANEAIEKSLQLVDMGLELRQLEGQRSIELRSSRIFIDEGLGDAAMEAAEGSVGILTYFVNELRKGERVTPYSFVTAIGQSSCEEGVMPADMADDEIVINQWLANDLGAKEGEAIEMSYYTLGPMRKLREERSCFRVRSIVPIKGAAADSGLVPDFPGIAEVKNCRDWKPGVPIELKRIREKDEEYWDMYRGTPKAFVTLKAGQEMWGNRYGKLTAIRYPLSEGAAEKTEAKLLSKVDSASVGLYFQSVRARNIKASNEGTDFGQLFLGLSMFLIVSAVVLTALVFVFGIEKRSQQTGMLKAVGFSLKLIRQLYLLEGVILAGVGAVAGVILSVIYTKAMLYGLANVWRGAVTGTYVHFHLEPETLILGACGGMAVSLFAIWVTLRRQLRSGVHELLSGIQWQFFISRPGAGGRGGLWIATAAIVGAGMLIAVMSR
ncbi:MAG: ABC transporter permease, partial [Planctomycetota bacterium]